MISGMSATKRRHPAVAPLFIAAHLTPILTPIGCYTLLPLPIQEEP